MAVKLKFKDILKQGLKLAGGVALNSVAPGSTALINEFLPEGKKLPDTATPQQAQEAIDSLPPEQKAQILGRELELKIAESNNWAQVEVAHAKSDQPWSWMRPACVLIFTITIAMVALAAVSALLVAILKGQADVIKAFGENWELMLVMLATPAAVVRMYFGLRTEEKKTRYAASVGADIPTGGAIANILKALKGS